MVCTFLCFLFIYDSFSLPLFISLKISWFLLLFRKSRSALSGLFHIHNQKPDFCELFVVFGGKLVFLIEENGESVIKDDLGVVIARAREKKKKHGFKVLLERMLPETADKEKKSCNSPSSSSMSNGLTDQWEKNQNEIQLYLSQLSSPNAGKPDCDAANEPLEDCVKEPTMPENMVSFLLSCPENIGFLKFFLYF